MVIRRMRVRSSGAIGRRPGRPVRRERRRQYVRQPCRCQRSTVSGFTTRREVCQPLNQRHAKIQKRRSTSSRRGRGLRRCRTTSCCRRQRLSAISSAFGWPAAANATSSRRGIDLSPCSGTARRLMLFNPVNGSGPRESQFCALQDGGHHVNALVRAKRGDPGREPHFSTDVSYLDSKRVLQTKGLILEKYNDR